jgi:hypothetical protein
MTNEIVTALFYFLFGVTAFLQLIMYYRRNKFLQALYSLAPKKKGHEMEIALQVVIPMTLKDDSRLALQSLRLRAIKATRFWFISLILSFVVLFGITR